MRPAPSGRAPVSAKSIAPAEVAPRASQRGKASGKSQRSERAGGVGGKKKVRGGPELIIAGGVLGLLAIACGAFYVMRTNEKKQVLGELEKRVEILNKNWKKGEEAFARADTAGRLYVMGKEEFSPDKQLAPFKGDADIWNVIYEKRYKDKKAADKTEVKAVDDTRMKLYPMNSPAKAEGDFSMTYGFADAEKKMPVVIASKNIKGPEGDTANLGGKITVVVKAEEDHNFENARNYKPPEKKEKAVEKKE